MKKIIVFLLIIIVSISLVACFEEIDTDKLKKTTEQVFISQNNIYGNVTFYKIYENTTQEVINRDLGKWDLAFQSAETGDIVLVNYTVSAKAIKTGISDFSAVDKGTVEDLFDSDDWKFNDPAYSNIKDSIALKDWKDKEVYLVYRGNTSLPQEAYYKIQFISETDNSYTFKYAHVESAEEIEKTIQRTEGLANIYFSFEDDSTVEYEPNIKEWDFYFAPYYGWYETLTAGVYSPYNLTGVMINNEGGVRVAQIFDDNIAYEDIDLNMAENLIYSDWKGSIGSTWKKIPSTENPVYHMDISKKYVIKLYDGNYYKLRFLDFYNTEGEKGYTSFELLIIE